MNFLQGRLQKWQFFLRMSVRDWNNLPSLPGLVPLFDSPNSAPHFLLAQRSFPRFHFEGMCARAHLHVVGLLWFYVKDFNQPSLPTPLYAVLVSVSVFMALSTVFHSINSPDNSPLFPSVLPALILRYWSLNYLSFFMKVSLSPVIILCGWPSLEHPLTN